MLGTSLLAWAALFFGSCRICRVVFRYPLTAVAWRPKSAAESELWKVTTCMTGVTTIKAATEAASFISDTAAVALYQVTDEPSPASYGRSDRLQNPSLVALLSEPA